MKLNHLHMHYTDIDYCNCLLMGTPNSVIQPLQKIHNFATRLVLLTLCHHQSTPLLEKLHWLPISERIKYKIACMCFSAINGSGPAYLSELLHVYTPSRTLRLFFWHLHAGNPTMTNARLMASTLSVASDPTFGIQSHKTLDTAQPCHLFKAKLKTFLFSQYFHPN